MEHSDDILIEKAISGDHDAFNILVERYQNKAYAVSLRLVKNHEDAMDCVQESFIKVYRFLNTFNFQSSFNTWLFRIVTNTTLDMLRKNKKHIKNISIDAPLQKDEDYYYQLEDPSTIEDVVLSKETVLSVHRAIDNLSDKLKVIIILYDIEGFSLQEISQITKLPLGTVKSRLFRARNRLLEILNK